MEKVVINSNVLYCNNHFEKVFQLLFFYTNNQPITGTQHDIFSLTTGRLRSMLNADQNSGIDLNVKQFRLIGIERYFGSMP